MRYPERLLSEDEKIVFDVHHHPVVLWKPVVGLAVFTALWLTGIALSGFFRHGAALIAGFVLTGLLLLWLAWSVLVWSRVNFVLTNHRLIYSFGVASRRARAFPLSGMSDISVSQTFLERVTGSGDLYFKPPGQQEHICYFFLPRPDRLKLQMVERIREAGQEYDQTREKSLAEEVAAAVARNQPTREVAPLPPERPPLYSEVIDQIDRLDGLRKRGVISEEEFRQAKEGLLKRLDREPGS